MNRFPSSPVYNDEDLMGSYYGPTFYNAQYENFHPEVIADQSSYLQQNIHKSTISNNKSLSKSESVKELKCPHCNLGELKPMFINLDECMFLCTNYQKEPVSADVSTPPSAQQLLSRVQEQRECESDRISQHKSEALAPRNDCCTIQSAPQSSAISTFGVSLPAQKIQQRGMNLNFQVPSPPPFHVMFHTDTNNDFLQMSKDSPPTTTKCLFPLEMREPWDNLQLTDFVCSSDDIQTTKNQLSKKFEDIRQGNFKSKVYWEALHQLESDRMLEDQESQFFRLEYEKEQERFRKQVESQQLINQYTFQNSTQQGLKRYQTSQSCQENQSTNSSFTPLF